MFTPHNEEHETGMLTLENLDTIAAMDRMNVDVGVQISHNRIWLCVNGVAFVRFRCTARECSVAEGNSPHNQSLAQGEKLGHNHQPGVKRHSA